MRAGMSDREVILGVLRRVARRLWVAGTLQEIGFGLSVILFSLVAFQMAWPTLAIVSGAMSRAALALAACGAGLALWRAKRESTLAGAAGAADRGERLKDELKTAYWLLVRRDGSAMGELQVARAARTAQRLDPRRIVPAQVPAGIWIAGLLMVVVVTSSLAPRISLSRDAVLPGATETPASLRSLLEGTGDDDRLRKLDQALAVLERPEVSAEQWQRAVLQAREAVDEANLRAVAARETLSRVASTMRARPQLQEVASALEEGRTDEAVDRLRKLAAEGGFVPQGLDSERARELQDGSAGGEGVDNAVQRQALRVDEDALSKAIERIEAATGALDSQRRASEVGRRMEDFLAAAVQRSPLTASRFGSRVGAPNPTPAPESGESDLRGGAMYRQGAVARDADDAAQDGNRAGASAGDSDALDPEGARTQRLDALLKLEVLQTADSPDGDEGRQGQASWHYEPTRGAEAKTGFAPLPERGRFTQATAIQAEHVDVHNRQAVRDYFIKLHESDTK
jgi:hypothetical protein